MWYWIFVKESIKKYIIVSEDDWINVDLCWWSYIEEGYEIFHDSCRSKQQAEHIMKTFHSEYSKLELSAYPISLKEAGNFVDDNHRHHISPLSHKWSIALHDGEDFVSVAIAGRPVARNIDYRKVLEVIRVCTKGIYKNACSMLYGKVYRIAKELGYKEILTYTLESEDGTSLRAAGFTCVGKTQGGSWDRKNRRRVDKHPTGPKLIWKKEIIA